MSFAYLAHLIIFNLFLKISVMTRVYDFCSNNDINCNNALNGLRQFFFQDRLFLVMEYVSGGELISLICKEGGFGEKRSWYVSQF